MKKIELINPIMINGKEVKELTYDPEKITADMFCLADAYAKSKCTEVNTISLGSAELDNGLHVYIGYFAVIAVNPEIDIKDLERLRGYDIIKIMKIGRNFTRGVVEEDETEETEDLMPKTSDTPSEAMHESITPVAQNSKECH